MFLLVITGLGFLLLTVAFRSLLIPALVAVLNFLTMRAAFGAIVAVFQHGIGTGLLGVGSAGPNPVTAKTHANRAMAKLGARDRAQLVVIAYETGLVRAGGT